MFKRFFGSDESLLGVDIGSSTIKVVEFDLNSETPRLLNVAQVPLGENVFSSSSISKAPLVSERLSSLVAANGISSKRVVTAVPGPTVFTKKLRMPPMGVDELRSQIQYEAANFIPHNLDAVHIDFHVASRTERNQYEVLVVAVKNEIVDSFLESIAMAGLETAILDVEYFALQNMFEFCYPEFMDDTVAILNIGARYTGLNICRGGDSLFTGDIPVGSRSFSETIASELQISLEEAEKLKTGQAERSPKKAEGREIIDRLVEQAAVELNRQLSFFWNASGAEDSIERIMITGGGSLTEGLLAELGEKTGLDCLRIDPLKNVEVGPEFEDSYLEGLSAVIGVAVGLGLRQQGDRLMPEEE